MHSCGNTAKKGWSWPNFWANLASFSLKTMQHGTKQPRVATVWKRLREVSLFGKTILWRHTLRTLWQTQAPRPKEGVVSQGWPELRDLAQPFSLRVPINLPCDGNHCGLNLLSLCSRVPR